MQRLPDQVRVLLPPFLQNLRWKARSYLVQIYYDDPAVHYEVWSIRKRDLLEVGLHMEGRDRQLNEQLFSALDECIFEIRARLGSDLELERWDKGWAKIYRTMPLVPFNQATLGDLATDMADMIRVLEPIIREARYRRTVLTQTNRENSP